jgi:membrane-bound inhibitor of C-type lysozyme
LLSLRIQVNSNTQDRATLYTCSINDFFVEMNPATDEVNLGMDGDFFQELNEAKDQMGPAVVEIG